MSKNNIILSILIVVIVILVGAVFYLLGRQSSVGPTSSPQIAVAPVVEDKDNGSQVDDSKSKADQIPDTSQEEEDDNLPPAPEENDMPENNTPPENPTPPANPNPPADNQNDNKLNPEECLTSTDCSEGEYCAKDMDKGCNSIGTCKQIPSDTLCVLQLDYVCGCDGKTYQNACFAAAYGVNVNYKGKCSNVDINNLKLAP